MPAQLAIYGCGSLGRELLSYQGFRAHTAPHPSDRVVWLDDSRNEGEVIDGVAVSTLYRLEADAHIVVAISDPIVRAKISWRLLQAGRALKSLRFSPAVGVAKSGARDSLILPFSLISCNVKIGRGLVMNTHCSIGHDCRLGRYVTLASHVGLCGHVEVGNHVSFGVGAVVLPGVKIGDDAVIGAGAVVVSNVPDGATMFGNPARKIN
jgi:sugar O-acyltransferase (sialic acid O-acetyltransferase NeuD family)